MLPSDASLIYLLTLTKPLNTFQKDLTSSLFPPPMDEPFLQSKTWFGISQGGKAFIEIENGFLISTTKPVGQITFGLQKSLTVIISWRLNPIGCG